MSDMNQLDEGWQERAVDVAANNENALEELAWAIETSVGQFKLLLARCNYTNLRSQLAERLQELTSVNIRILELKKSDKTLYTKIQAEVKEEQPDALMIFGLESVDDLDHLLTTTNQVREEFRKNFHFPLVLWVNDEVLKKLMQLAPDFESWAITTAFAIATDELIDFLRQKAEQIFQGNLILDLEASREIKLACHDLQKREQVLDLEIKAIIEYLLGETEYVNRNTEAALKHYKQSLELWQQINHLERQVKLLIDIAFCYYVKTPRYREGNSSTLQQTRDYAQQSFDLFEQLHYPDLSVNLLLKFGDILQVLQEWGKLQTLGQKALEYHQTQKEPLKLAINYGFIAEVALAQERWHDAEQLARKSLKNLLIHSRQSLNNPRNFNNTFLLINNSRYLFILAKAQQNLGQTKKALSNLEKARQEGKPEENPGLYLDILNNLQKLYFEQRQYLKAFEIKLQQQSVEQQYGFRAFVGAGRIQPQRQAELALTKVETQENVAQEIDASGRLLDVNKLVERIGRNDYKLIVIHGQSGVGKSSLVNGGLLPALKQKSIGTQDVLPVLIRVYTSWVTELGRLLTEALEKKGIHLTTPLDSTAAILAQIEQSNSRNLRIVLIFDQFEEFFFVYSAPMGRRRFFEFLADCLKILSVKIILSLREDYLHYLLECNRLPSMEIISNDILSKNILYPLGNFSPADAEKIIHRLTERSNFHLGLGLVEKLVQDLAGELGEVRPIELQIVGAQLQAENITTVAEYQKCGQKEELVKRYLAEVVKDCGAENQQVAELVLYLLTDEKGTRPLKTEHELERDLKVLAILKTENSKLNLIFKIFVDSGLVLRLKESPDDRYQLVHDYLAVLIRRQKEPELKDLRTKLEAETKKRQNLEKQMKELEANVKKQRQILREAQAQRDKVQKDIEEAQVQLRKAETAQEEAQIGTKLERAGVNALRQFEFQQIDGLLSAMRAGQELKALVYRRPLEKYPATSPLLALQTIVYKIREQNRLEGHTSGVTSVNFSPDGQRIVTASWDKTARVWGITGKLLAKLKGHTDSVTSASFSLNGQHIVTTSLWENTAWVWDITGKLLAKLKGHISFVTSTSFSLNGERIVTASWDKTARVWDMTGNLVAELQGHTDSVTSASFSPDGERIVTTSRDNTARVWDMTGNLVVELQGHTRSVNSASFSPDGQCIVTTSSDNTARVWDMTGNLVAELLEYRSRINSASFSLDGQRVVTTSSDNTARVWDMTGNLVAELQGHTDTVNSASFSPDGQRVVTASSDNTARVWDMAGNLIAKLQGHTDSVTSASFSPDGQRVVTASWDKTARVWGIAGKLAAELQGHTRSASFSLDGQRIVTTSLDNRARVWDIAGNLVAELQGHTNSVNSASLSPDGQRIVTASSDKTARVWDITGKLLATLQWHTSSVYSASFSPDGQRIVTTSRDKTARVWDITGKLLATLQGHTKGVKNASFSSDGECILTASSDKTARLWDITGDLVAKLQGHTNSVNSASFSLDGQRILTASLDKTARLWDITGNLVAKLQGHTDTVNSASFSPDGERIVTASSDNTARVW
ncbi:nSTAND1 domain-containing NTPase, partial [Nostoc sp.]|uniref:nSTAND1 domain-containing NTPase n=1 Tax=Nostoc sp. TaxID=1180 RepID=UPI002FF8E4CB